MEKQVYKVFYENDSFGEKVVLKKRRYVLFGLLTIWEEIANLPVNRGMPSSLVGIDKFSLMELLWNEYVIVNSDKKITKQKEQKFNYWVNSLK